MTGWLRALGGRCASRPLIVIAVWVGVAAAITILSFTVGGSYTHSSTLPGTQVQAAEELLSRHLPSASHESADVLVHTTSAAGTRAAVPLVVAATARLPHVVPGPPPVRWSRDGTTADVLVEY